MNEKEIVRCISLPRNIKYTNFNGIVDVQATIHREILRINEKFEESLVMNLYEIYKDSDISELYVISEPEFKKFLMEMLPKYLNKEDN